MALLLLYHTFAFLSLFSYSLYHLTLSSRSFFKNPSSHSARPYHPLPLRHPLLRHLPLLLSLLSLLLSLSHYLSLSLSSSSSSVSSLSYLHTSLSLLLFSLLSLSPLLPLPPDLTFLLSSLSFSLLSLSPSPSPSPSDLQSLTHSLSATISSASALFSLALSLLPRLFLLEIALASSISLQALWSLQTGLTLYVDKFIPEGCHRLLDVSEATTRCDLDASRARAGRILDLAFAIHAAIVAVVVVAVYVAVGRACGGGGEKGLGRRYNGGSYEALPTVGSGGAISDMDHVQMKAIVKSSAQA